MTYTVKDNAQNILKTNNLFKAIQVASKQESYTVFSHQEAIYRNDDKLYNFDYKGFNFKLDSKSKRYIELPINCYLNSQNPIHVEYHTGAYNYLYSKPGYSSIEVILDLSKTIYTLPVDDSKWAGYIIINHLSHDQIDVGLSAQVVDHKIELRPFYYYMGGQHPKSFRVHAEVVAEIPIGLHEVDLETKLKIIMKKVHTGWTVEYENLSLGLSYKYTYEYSHKKNIQPINRFLVGVSLCPVGETIWDPTSKASFKHIRFESCILDDNVLFNPNSASMLEGYSQGIPCATMSVDKDSFIWGVDYNL